MYMLWYAFAFCAAAMHAHVRRQLKSTAIRYINLTPVLAY